MMPKTWIKVAALGAAFVLGFGTAWKLYRPRTPKAETAAPAQRQADGSLILERKPMPEAQARAAVKVPEVPKGSKLERVGKLEFLPSIPTGGQSTLGSGALAHEKPYEIDWSIVKQKDGGQRMIGSSPDGTVVGGLDIPVAPDSPEPRKLKWAAGIDYTVTTWGNAKSLVLQRDLGPLVLVVHGGVETISPPGGGMLHGGQGGVSLLVRFGH